jgi:T-complex protein 1 subunit alpha
VSEHSRLVSPAQVDDIGEVTITNDGATILKQLEVKHPAAKVLVDLADLQVSGPMLVGRVWAPLWLVAQDKEVGDGTTSVVIIAGELLRRGHELVRAKVHPTSIMAGYRIALKESIRYIKEKLLIPSSTMSRELLISAAKTSMSSKIISKSSDFFSTMVVDAVQSIGRKGGDGKLKYPVKAINVIKIHGKSSLESALVDGLALSQTRATTAMPSSIKGVKVACIDFPLHKHRMQLGVQVLVTDPSKLEAIRQRELDITKEKIQKLLAAGANVIVSTKGIDDLCLKYLVDAGCIGVRRVPAEDIKRLAQATGATILPNLADLEGEESVDAAALGIADEIVEDRVGDGELLFFRGCAAHKAASLVLRGANEFMLEEVHRSLHDAMCVVQRVLESNTLVCGGGAVEAALAMHLDEFAMTMGSREQLAVKEFAEALLIIPKTLAVNAAKDATDLIATLCAYHHTSQSVPEKEGLKYYGLDLKAGAVVDNFERGVLEPAMSKVKSLRFATEAAVTIMRIDDRITIRAAEQDPRAGGHHH